MPKYNWKSLIEATHDEEINEAWDEFDSAAAKNRSRRKADINTIDTVNASFFRENMVPGNVVQIMLNRFEQLEKESEENKFHSDNFWQKKEEAIQELNKFKSKYEELERAYKELEAKNESLTKEVEDLEEISNEDEKQLNASLSRLNKSTQVINTIVTHAKNSGVNDSMMEALNDKGISSEELELSMDKVHVQTNREMMELENG